ncbi:MAG TPA: protein kinase [Candidatus Solibacter sp.]|nr:protein kinase [Candidatus Solibacter sp.]
MPLTSGTKLGPYEIQAPLGAGGMGEVYRACDTRLDRTVAIKVLASHLSSSPELKQRMEREARAISSLNHPHICQLYDVGSQDGSDFLVMEFLEGETLGQRLSKGPLPLHEIYKIGIAVAEALAVAHRHGIIHRDLKPGNIMLTHSGAKLMDFGLAKPLSPSPTGAASSAPPSFTAAATLSGPSPLSPLTTAGTIIGTIQYMSPEQIEGKEADARSDIFAFGAVLYEMAAGKRPFQGKSQISLASAILESDPEPISKLKPLTPSVFEHVVTTCLQKNPDDRYLAAHDIKLELQWIASERLASQEPAPAQQANAAAARRSLAWMFAVIASLLLGAIAGFLLHRSAPVPSVYTAIDAPQKTRVNLTGDSAGPPTLSPDGTMIAFTATDADGKTTIWVRSLNSLDARQLDGTDHAIFPFWSFDNHSLGFFAEGKLKAVDLAGGSAQVIADAPIGRGGAWGADGVIVFSPASTDRLYSVGASGGTPAPLTTIDGNQHTSHRWPFFLPDGKHFLYLAINHTPSLAGTDTIYYASVDGRENKPLLKAQSNAIYVDGYLLFARNEHLLAQPFNPSSGALSGQPQTLVNGVINDPVTWHMDVTASNDGLLIYGSGGSGEIQLLWMDRATKQLSVVTDNIADLESADISPRGDRIALEIGARGSADIWVLDLASGTRTRLTFGPGSNVVPVWSPDGKWIVYYSRRNGKPGIFRKLADGSGAEEELLSDDQPIVPWDWSRDGKYILYQHGIAGTQDIWALPLEGDRKPFLVVPTTPKTSRTTPRLSPDGRWLTYVSNESGSVQAYVVAFKGGPGKWQLSAKGGYFPIWSHDGKELYYYVDSANAIYAVPVKEVAGALQFGAPQTLVNWSAPDPWYEVSPDGKKILLYRVTQQVSDSVAVVTNFTSMLKK